MGAGELTWQDYRWSRSPLRDVRWAFDAGEFKEGLHPRGQPENKGQFAKKSEVSSSAHKSLTEKGFTSTEGEEARYRHESGHTMSFLPKGIRENEAWNWVHHDPEGKEVKRSYGSSTLSTQANKVNRGEFAAGVTQHLESPGWKTPEEVSKGFRELCGTGCWVEGPVDPQSFVRKANVTAAVVKDLQKRYPGLVKNWKLQSGFQIMSKQSFRNSKPADSNAIADYDYRFGSIRMVDSLRATENVGGLPKRGQWTVGTDFNTTLAHEIGHSIQGQVMRTYVMLHGGSFFDAFNAQKKTLPKTLSKYSATNSHEWIAESFAAYSHPRYEFGNVRIDQKLKAAFDEVLK